ncbi:MAG: ABC transporter permease [Candidatus Competibacterales bacterium]
MSDVVSPPPTWGGLNFSPWHSVLIASKRFLPAVVIVVAVMAPLAAVLSFVGTSTDGLWPHLVETRLGEYLSNSLVLLLGVGALTLVFGTGCAWLVTLYRFPGRAWLEWALVLPLAMPAYVLAYTYTDFLQFTGPLQTALRDLTGWGWRDYWFPNIHSPGGAAFVLAGALYPYVYVTARAAFVAQSVCALEVSRTLGCTPWGMFWRVGLPLARPAIIAGTMFVLMETLADFGAVSYFEVHTFTTGIYRAWYSYGSPAAAAQLAAVLLLFVYSLLLVERWSEGQRRFSHTSSRYRAMMRLTLPSWGAWLATGFCLLPVTVGFVLPAIILLSMVWDAQDVLSWGRLLTLTLNTVTLGFITCAIIIAVGLTAVYGMRRDHHPAGKFAMRLALLGYATPGVVIAVGLLIVLGALDRWLNQGLLEPLGWSGSILLSGTLFAVVYGCTVRFFAVAYSPLEAGFRKIRPSFEDAARTLGARPTRLFRAIHLPLLRGSLLSAVLLVLVDVMKELPATMILRPFNFDTLAVEAYQLATTERLDGAAGPALIIVLVGLIPVVVLCRAIARSRPGHSG